MALALDQQARGDSVHSAATSAGAKKRSPSSARRGTLSAPRNLVVSRRTRTTISFRWMRARGGRRPHRYVVYVNRRKRLTTRRRAVTLKRLRCGKRYRLWLATRDRGGRLSRRKKLWVRTNRCPARRVMPAPIGGSPGAGSSEGTGAVAGSSGSVGGTPGPLPPVVVPPPGTGIPPGGGPPTPGVGTALPSRLPLSAGATFHVATTGSDSAAGTEAAPWRTVQKALGVLRAGETVMVHGGVYSQNLTLSRAGTAAAPITVRNAPGEAAVLRPASGSGDDIPLQIGNGAAFVRFYGLTFERATGSSTANVYAWGNAHDVEISGCEIRDSQRQGFFSEKTVSRIHIIGCTFRGNGGSGPVQQDHNVYVQGSHNAVLGNLLTGAVNGFGVQVYPSSDHALIAGNTITGNFRDGIVIGGGGGDTTSDSLVVNNVITSSRSAISTFWGGSVGTGNIVRNNLAWDNGSEGFDSKGLASSGNLTADPLYVNAGAGDYHLGPGSPALGLAESAFVLSSDIDGNPRPLGGASDLGAFEG